MLRISSVRILDINNMELATMQDPGTLLEVAGTDSPSGIEVKFENAALDYNSVIDGSTFDVRLNNAKRPGQITALPNNTVLWNPRDPAILPVGRYKITLVGGPPLPAITSAPSLGLPRFQLDGEPLQLPSGDGTEGGDFVFRLHIR
jgi:hypothetical protein